VAKLPKVKRTESDWPESDRIAAENRSRRQAYLDANPMTETLPNNALEAFDHLNSIPEGIISDEDVRTLLSPPKLDRSGKVKPNPPITRSKRFRWIDLLLHVHWHWSLQNGKVAARAMAFHGWDSQTFLNYLSAERWQERRTSDRLLKDAKETAFRHYRALGMPHGHDAYYRIGAEWHGRQRSERAPDGAADYCWAFELADRFPERDAASAARLLKLVDRIERASDPAFREAAFFDLGIATARSADAFSPISGLGLTMKERAIRGTVQLKGQKMPKRVGNQAKQDALILEAARAVRAATPTLYDYAFHEKIAERLGWKVANPDYGKSTEVIRKTLGRLKSDNPEIAKHKKFGE